MSKMHESKMAIRAYFTVKHGGNLLGALFLASAESITSGDGQGQSQVDPLEQLRSRFSPAIEFGKHKAMKRVVNRGCDFRCNYSVSLSVHHEDARCTVKLMHIFCDTHLL